MNVKVFYYGCANNDSGHYLFAPGMQQGAETQDVQKSNPWGLAIDGGIHPPQTEWCTGLGIPENASLRHVCGWTALTFWDRTVDSRPGSNVCFLANGHYRMLSMRELFENAFPEIWKRLHSRFSEVTEVPTS